MISRRDMLKTSGAALAGLAGIPGAWSGSQGTRQESDDDLTRHVDPFIGTAAHGHTYPGAQVPFGMVQLSPDNGVNGWDWSSGYHWSSDRIVGFSHTHLSGTGIGDMYDVLFMPTLLRQPPLRDVSSSFSHDREQASPGYYFVDLLDTGIGVELTATERVGVHRYAFPSTEGDLSPAVVIDLGHSLNWDTPTDTALRVESPTQISGYRMSTGWASDQRVYFAASFSLPFSSHWLESEWANAGARQELNGTHVRGCFLFPGRSGQNLLVKVAISPTSIEGAKRNLREETPGWNFDSIREAARESWNRALSRIRIQTATNEQRVQFYTALYHALLAPQLFCDADGSYRGPDGETHRAPFANHSVFSLWDTFRAEHPLLTLIQPDRVDSLIQSMMAFYRQSGLLPVWSLAGCETNTMIGYHSAPVILDAWSKGLTRIDPREALEAMKASALQDAEGLRYYRLPEPTGLEELREASNESDLQRIASIERRHLNTHGRLANGFERRLSGDSFRYHSPFPDCRSAFLVRTEDGNGAVEWETGSAPESAGEEMISFVWLAGMDATEEGREFELFVNDRPWVSFRGPQEGDRSFRVRGPNGSSLTFRATHTDQYNDLFGFMFLTLPAGTVASGERLRLRVRGEAAGTRDWYMTFDHNIEARLRAENVYGLVSDGDQTKQLVRVDVEHMDNPADASIRIGDGEPFRTRLQFGHNSILTPAPQVSSETPAQVTLSISRGPTYETKILLRPVRPYSYIPSDWEPESVSKTLEYAYDDWCIARLALAMDEPEDTDYFSLRAGYYRSLFDSTTGFMRARLADGSWRVPFSPSAASHRQEEYTEGNAWQYSWFVPHDVRGLVELMGGRDAFVAKLDELFETSSDLEGDAPPDISGLIGQYAHGNEPSHHIAYLYAYAGAPWRTQERVRQISEELYGTGPDGLSGNEDCGQMSAWYIFSALGFYPVNPADGTYVIGTPHFERASIDLGGGRTFTVEAPGVSPAAKYIQSATLNDRSLDRCYITHEEIVAGGTLVFRMGDAPNPSWAASEVAAPPSMTR